MLMVPFRQHRQARDRYNIHSMDPKDRPWLFCGNPGAAGTITGVKSIHGAVDAGSPFAGIEFQGLAKRGQIVI